MLHKEISRLAKIASKLKDDAKIKEIQLHLSDLYLELCIWLMLKSDN